MPLRGKYKYIGTKKKSTKVVPLRGENSSFGEAQPL
ncbi:hypothetical protein FHS57_004561 [Runella defluvii]|uniref:Uncharacterized protein n=1 Tax=Runella defluvii TaxID=370973 RepID=A0A7W6ESI4_9BACT|nr:hypothetical protein [Runella defluvii]